MPTTIVRDKRFLAHDPGPYHPESPARLAAIHDALPSAKHPIVELPLRTATVTEIARAHGPALIERLKGARGRAEIFDPDTRASPDSVDTAFLAAGATIDLFRAVTKKETPPGIALVRPPGHHAVVNRAMGFCLVNNVAVAAHALLAEGLAERIAIYDWDVHHGNGTQDIFYEDPRVLYASTHQWPFYPGTGAKEQTGRGAGAGTTLNVPLPAGTTDETLLAVTDEIIGPRVIDFAPDVILISAGFDPFVDDPLGGFSITVDGFRELAGRWRDIAEKTTDGRIAAVLEGGYDTDGLARSVMAVLDVWNT